MTRVGPPGVMVAGVSIFMKKETLVIKGEPEVLADVKEDEYRRWEVGVNNISRLNGLVRVIRADTERLLWISVYLRILALGSRSKIYWD